ncbi:MAG: hypothetical protein EKK41_04710 [Hyphomicrobiales bacterium]|nr:MAG: hypothetical protein EKK41_04710 [Hyphomicrobiales bacterium]
MKDRALPSLPMAARSSLSSSKGSLPSWFLAGRWLSAYHVGSQPHCDIFMLRRTKDRYTAELLLSNRMDANIIRAAERDHCRALGQYVPPRTIDGRAMNRAPDSQAFANPERFLADLRVPENVAAIAQQSVAQSRDLFTKGTSAVHDNAKAMTEIADTAWGSTKMLQEKLVQNAQATAEATFAAAASIAAAKSIPEIARLQHEFVQTLSSQAQEQTKEFFDLSARAAQHVFEKVQAAATRTLKPGA